MLVAAITCLAFIVLPSNSSPLPVLVPSNLKNTDYLEGEQASIISSNEQKLNAPPFQCRAPPCTPNRILHRAKRTIDLFPFSLLKVADGWLTYSNWIHREAILLGMYVVCTCFFQITSIFRWACLERDCRYFLMLPSEQTTMPYLSEFVTNSLLSLFSNFAALSWKFRKSWPS